MPVQPELNNIIVISHSQKKQPAGGLLRPNSDGLSNKSVSHNLSNKMTGGSKVPFAPYNYCNMPVFSPANIVQAKLSVNAPGDKYEQEADAIAETVSQTSTGSSAQPVTNNSSQPVPPKEEANGKVSSHLNNKIENSKGSGNSIDGDTQALMSNRLGADFSSVKIHSDDKSQAMNHQLNAKAFTTGEDIYFNEGEYNPASSAGKKLLAHELVHVVQQRKARSINAVQRAMGDGHDLQSPRFAGNLKLEDAFDPAGPAIKSGDTGMHVRIIQQALVDAGEILPSGVDGDFRTETEAAIKSFQTKQGFTAGDITGMIDAKTMEELDNYFLKHSTLVTIPQGMVPSTAPSVGAEWATGKAPTELSKGTRKLASWDIAEIERRRTTEVIAPPGGSLPDFHMTIGSSSDSYEKRIEDVTLKGVDDEYKAYGKGKAADHADPTKLHQMSDIEKVGVASKREADRVFGNFAIGNPLKAGVNLKDAWDQKVSEFAAGGAAYEQNSVEWRVEKIMQSPKYTGQIDIEHGAVQSRTTVSPGEAKAEATILKDIRDRIIAIRRTELIETHKGWPGFADPPTRSVFIQTFKSATDSKNRDFMWRQFHTLVHEYIHTLAHSRYADYADNLPEQKGGKTYREGMTDYFTKMVLESTVIDDALRTEVEGPFHDPKIIHSIKAYGGYKEAANAEAVAGVAGLKNVMAAYFLGKIELIGG